MRPDDDAYTTDLPLPTVEEAQEFLAVINRGREAIGLPVIDTLDYDACEPNSSNNCLSAHHLFRPAGYNVYAQTIVPPVGLAAGSISRTAVANALGMTPTPKGGYLIPAAIKVVTDAFDDLTFGLRDRLVEAGIVTED